MSLAGGVPAVDFKAEFRIAYIYRLEFVSRFFFRGLATLTDENNFSTVESVPLTHQSH
jgi:hypothetical protein